MKTIFKLLLFLLVCSCSSIDDSNECNEWYYVYTLEDCDCESNTDPCATYNIISEETYYCLNDFLVNSENQCVFIDESVCSEITFSGYIKEVISDCFEFDF